MSRRPANMTSHTELSTLASCEMKWSLRYREHLKGDDSPQLELGRLIDKGVSALLTGQDWYALLQTMVAEEGADPSYVVLEDIDGPASTAAWLIKRYDEHYEPKEDPIKVVATQLDLTAKIPGTNQTHRAIIDELWEYMGQLWMVERKTYGRNDRLQLVDVDPQLTLNLWVARQNGYDCAGIVFDGIYTYRWKPTKPTQAAMLEEHSPIEIMTLSEGGTPSMRPATAAEARDWARQMVEKHPGVERAASESFDRMWLDRHDDHIAAALDEVRGGIQRRNALRRGARPLRNIGPSCRYCAQRPTCFERLAFSSSVLDIDLEDA